VDNGRPNDDRDEDKTAAMKPNPESQGRTKDTSRSPTRILERVTSSSHPTARSRSRRSTNYKTNGRHRSRYRDNKGPTLSYPSINRDIGLPHMSPLSLPQTIMLTKERQTSQQPSAVSEASSASKLSSTPK